MCGFAGELLLGPGQADESLARRMAERLRHRGPDEEGFFSAGDGRCAIGFRRLRVIDPAGSRQPMSLPDGSLTVAFNGEIYNYRALRRQLIADGAVFSSEGDTEVLLHMYRCWGSEMLNRLDGMFAFAIYDSRAGELFLARDRIGQKPLWYAKLADRIVFASEAKALLRHPNISRDINLPSLVFYATTGYIPAPRSAWRDISKLQPGHYMKVGGAGGAGDRPKRYWAPLVEPPPPTLAEAVDRVRYTVTRAVEARMAADVPLGALLSGGVDSAIIVACMCRAAGRTGGVRTFTAGFTDEAYDERPAARAISAHCGTDHTELLVQPSAAEMLDDLVNMYDEPFADSSALPTYLICRGAREHVTVALTGDGGDEVFGGYDRYRAIDLAQRMKPSGYLAVRTAAFFARLVAPLNERNKLRRFVRFADALGEPFAVQYLTYRSLFMARDLPRLLTDSTAAAIDTQAAASWFCDLYEQGDLEDEAARTQRHDLLSYLPDDLLVKADIASMASSLELRAPMLDHRLVNLGLSLPTAMKISPRRGKLILKAAFGDMLGDEVFHRPKRGFGLPLAKWLRGGLRRTLLDTLLDPALERKGIFRRESLVGLINDHLSGKDDHSHRLWALLVLARWLD